MRLQEEELAGALFHEQGEMGQKVSPKEGGETAQGPLPAPPFRRQDANNDVEGEASERANGGGETAAIMALRGGTCKHPNGR